ncbi:menaquinone biosynthesis family protein [Algisphaera agarilytica]|uniref:1,4-dihydroxy-6-naphtoate synthase n=1 Tax=Algisphaera agarilytica TaxID=1385975 RepID=A0A7X0H665_9BACT|nr:MqnA/MqnD/SBP family protein [Algisphaera agarilytica]MBB6429787.1 1,4-dihydroxy-6-naphthoate synthase [Algisphaera agarilytica]
MSTAPTQNKTLHIGHSPDPDDAFMWYPLANFTAPDGTTLTPKIDTKGYDFVHVLEDIQSLNVRSEKGELEITAFSVHEYPYVADKYAMTSCGSSMGDNYGPMIVCPPDKFKTIEDLKSAKLAIPGERTTAWLSCQLLLAEHGLSADDLDWQPVMFDEILQKVESGEFDAGLIIHEGQITFQNNGLEKLVDLGTWWTQSRNLPLPLGANAIRRDLVESGEARTICRILLDSIEYALEHREASVNFALNYARDMGADLADKFVGMYVNDWTLDYGERGRQAVRQLIQEGIAAGLLPDCGEIDFIEPA